ncbi:phytanoyl-CoA dioxygenase family protein [Paenibacillus psychroresistens]|uniref:Phytanoyl-CoA dioxygenase family protein n=1 Tax=Paenibacillus psychroresistens TaxID=1778678 RepID=A0A6B8RGQ0_9BACL|nr:phytanoyl-CoA dioxygenase family protein [Paenibacillus psychroresistens]QGQ95117.1 phytanoyl-CoA dioxygenase family protein [Paenibacillus psychroresistens]
MTQDQLKLTKEGFEQAGYALFPNVLDNGLMNEAKQHIEWLIEKNPHIRPESLGTNLVKDDPFWLRLVSDDRLLDIAEQFIGPNIALFASHYISKPPFDGQPVLWHQDGSYWPLEPMNVVSLWLAVDDSLPENGCLCVIPETHTMELQQMKKNLTIANVLESEVDPALVEEDKAVDLILSSGGVSVHHPNVIHGSKANHSPLRRCGLTIRYIPTSTIITTANWPSAFLLRGKAISGINDYLPKPKYNKEKHMPFQGCEEWI